MVERVDAEDPVDALVGQVEAMPVETQERRRGLRPGDGLAFEQLARDIERGRRHVADDDLAPELRQEATRPARTRAEVEHADSGERSHARENLRETREDLRCVIDVRGRLREEVVGRREVLSVVVVGGVRELIHGVVGEEVAHIHRVFGRGHDYPVDVGRLRRMTNRRRVTCDRARRSAPGSHAGSRPRCHVPRG